MLSVCFTYLCIIHTQINAINVFFSFRNLDFRLLQLLLYKIMDFDADMDVDCEQKVDRFGSWAIKLLEKLTGMPAELTKELYNRHKNDGSKVPKLRDLCVNLIATTNVIVDSLFDIYGPYTNFPIRKYKPNIGDKKIKYTFFAFFFLANRLVEAIQSKTKLKYEQSFKLALLLVNNSSTSCLIRNEVKEGDPVGVKWQTILWEKLSSLASQTLLKFEDATDYTQCLKGSISHIDVALPHLAKFKNLQVLDMPKTIFKNKHLVEIAQSLPNLKCISFEIFEGISGITFEAMCRLEKLEAIICTVNLESPNFDYALSNRSDFITM